MAEGEEMDAAACLQRLVESSQRQEQLMEKMCTLFVNLDTKIGRVAAGQERLEAAAQSGGGTRELSGSAPGRASFTEPDSRGQMIRPIGHKPESFTAPSPPPAPDPRIAAAQRQAESERANAERFQLQRREEEIRRRQEEDDRRIAEEAAARRAEEERRVEQERQRKAGLEARTKGMMSSLITDGPSDLFGDDLGAKPKKAAGGLFDDDD